MNLGRIAERVVKQKKRVVAKLPVNEHEAGTHQVQEVKPTEPVQHDLNMCGDVEWLV